MYKLILILVGFLLLLSTSYVRKCWSTGYFPQKSTCSGEKCGWIKLGFLKTANCCLLKGKIELCVNEDKCIQGTLKCGNAAVSTCAITSIGFPVCFEPAFWSCVGILGIAKTY